MKKIKKTYAYILSICFILLISVSVSYAWIDHDTHPAITSYALDNSTFILDKFLENSLGLNPVQSGVESADEITTVLHSDIVNKLEPRAGEKGDENNNLFRGKRLYVFFGIKDNYQNVNYSPIFFGLLSAKFSANLRNWILIGSCLEDKPMFRAKHHFFNRGRQGINNTSSYIPINIPIKNLFRFYYFDSALYYLLHSILYDGMGISSYKWAIMNSSEINAFSYPAYNKYLFKAFVYAESREERETYLSLSFLSLGHILHLFEDTGVPAHVRNDFIDGHLQFVDCLEVGNPFESFVSSKYKDSLNLPVDSNNIPYYTSLREAWDKSSAYARDNFFSYQSTPDGFYPSNKPDIFDPKEVIVERVETAPSKYEYYFFRNLPEGRPTGTDLEESGRYRLAKLSALSSEWFNRIFRFYDIFINSNEKYLESLNDHNKRIRLLNEDNSIDYRIFELDANIYEDYAKLIIPKIKANTVGLVNHIFRGK